MNNFKISKKNVHSDTRSSVLEKYDNTINDINLETQKVNVYKKQLCDLKKLDSSYENMIKIDNLQHKIHEIENNEHLTSYLFNIVDFLKEEPCIEDKKDTNEGINKYISLEYKDNKGTTYNNYMERCHGIKQNVVNKNKFICTNCNYSTLNSSTEGITICYNCGLTRKLNFSINPEWNSYETCEFTKPFSYKRSNHFKEWISQIQGREGTTIPEEVINNIIIEIKKERISNKKCITYDKIKEYLKKLKLNKYYEHIPNIIHKITGNTQLIISRDLEIKLTNMFDKIQAPFEKCCPTNRKNFLSYSYTLYKFFQILELNEYLIYFPLLKSREKLFEQENIWKNICKELNWKFIKCI